MSDRQAEEQLRQLLDTATTQVTIGATYRHYRGNSYKVLNLGIFTENSTEVGVVYQAQYGQQLVFIRPLSMWNEEVEFEGIVVSRFKEV